MCTDDRTCEACHKLPLNGRLKLLMPDNMQVCVRCYQDAHAIQGWKPQPTVA